MVEFLYSVDKAIFYFCNQTIANPVFDTCMPILTDLNQRWYGILLFAVLWLLLLWKGGRRGRTAALLLVPLIAMTDQLNSSVIKKIVERARPCHVVNGVQVLEHIRLLVNCGSGYSFPSSHAVNNFAAAALLSHYYRYWSPAFYAYAGLVAFSRISVGVHYPSDVLGGAAIGAFLGMVFIRLWQSVEERFPALSVQEPAQGSGLVND